MTNTTKLFQLLRKEGHTAAQRLGDCRSCATANDPNIQVFTHDQSYNDNHTMVYFHGIAGSTIKSVADENGIPYNWDGSDETAFMIWEKV